MLMIDATYIPVHRTACSHGTEENRGERGAADWQDAGRRTSELRIVTDEDGRPIDLYLSGGNVSDYDGAKVLAYRGYEAIGPARR